MNSFSPIIAAIRQAAEVCQRIQHLTLSSVEKAQNDPVTLADYAAQAVLCRAIRTYYPQDGVVAEEQSTQYLQLLSDQQRFMVAHVLSEVLNYPVTQDHILSWLEGRQQHPSARFWTIDPIDGTKGFLALRHYAVGVALIEDGQPSFGAIAAPLYQHGTLFYTSEEAAYMEPLLGGAATPIHVSHHSLPEEIKIVKSVEKAPSQDTRVQSIWQAAGITLTHVEEVDSMEKYGRIACGEADVYIRLARLHQDAKHKIWDHAPGAALVTKAGGKVTDLDGQPLHFSENSVLPNRGVIASNGLIHQMIVEAVAHQAS